MTTTLTADQIPGLLEDWASDEIAHNDGGLGYSSQSALVGFVDPPSNQRPGSVIPRGAVDGYGSERRRMSVIMTRAIARLSANAQQRIRLRYLAKPRLNRQQEANYFEQSESSVKRAWRELRGGLLVEILNDLRTEG